MILNSSQKVYIVKLVLTVNILFLSNINRQSVSQHDNVCQRKQNTTYSNLIKVLSTHHVLLYMEIVFIHNVLLLIGYFCLRL